MEKRKTEIDNNIIILSRYLLDIINNILNLLNTFV